MTQPPAPIPSTGGITQDELQLATRNHGMPLEALRYDITPAGLHYLLIHFDIPQIDVAAWRLRIGGLVDRPLELTLDDLRAFPPSQQTVTLECAGNGRARLEPRPLSQPWLVEAVGTASWTGVRLGDLLEQARVSPNAVEAVFTGADHGVEKGREHDYARSLTIDEARRRDVVVAYEMNDAPLPPQHGFPARLLVPGWYGMASVKWLTTITLVDTPFDGYQQSVAYWVKSSPDDIGRPVRWMQPRALLVPPGFPDFITRRRTVEAGLVTLTGRAWSGSAPVSRVEVGVDGLWNDAELGPALGPYAWRAFTFPWEAAPGERVLSCRASDEAGNVQPVEAPWNVQGMANNLVQRVEVLVR